MQRFEPASLMGGPSLRVGGGLRMQRETIGEGTQRIQDELEMSLGRRNSSKEEYCKARSCVDGQFS